MTDIVNPIITIVSPTPGSVNNSNTSTIEATITDGYGSGVDLSSITATVNGAYAIKNGVAQSGFTASAAYVTLTDVQVLIQRNLPYQDLQSVNVSISAKDVTGNPAATSVFSFITEDTSGAIIINPTPSRDAIQVSPNTPIFFNIRQLPRETDLKIETLRVGLRNLDRDVDGTPLRDEDGDPILDGYGLPKEALFVEPGVPYDQRQVSITADSDGLGYSITIIPLYPLPLASEISVNIQILDEAGNLTDENYTFATIDDAAPFVSNQLPSPNSQANSIATPISFSVGDRVGSFLGSGVDLETLVVEIDNEQAIVNGVIQSNFAGSIDENPTINGYDVVVARSTLFAPRKSINVDVSVADISNNLLKTSFVFGTEDVIPPQIQFVYPQDNATNIAQDATVIIDINSEVAVEEIDINSVSVILNGLEVLSNNTFDNSVVGSLSASSAKTLTITLRPVNSFVLGASIPVAISARDVFGNLVQSNISYTVTTQTSLETIASPAGNIYYKGGIISNFPSVGSSLTITLTANRLSTNIYYTIDGSTPAINFFLVPQGTTQLYTAPFKIPSTDGWRKVQYFAFDTSSNEQESIKTSDYFFTYCPEEEEWKLEALRSGLEYTLTPKFVGSQYVAPVVTTKLHETVGITSYQHDLGRQSYIDELSFDIFGLSHFRVRIADTLEQLRTASWCNQLLGLASGQHVSLHDGYATDISVIGDVLHIEGRKRTFGTFNEEAFARVEESLGKAFAISADARLPVTLSTIVGAKSFIRLYDDVFNLEVQQIVSKINAAAVNAQLTNRSSLIGEDVQVFIDGYSIFEPGYGEGYAILGSDGYEAITDGEKGFVSLFPPPSATSETLQFSYSRTLPIDDELFLEDDTTSIYAVTSVSPSIYNTFAYEASERQRITFQDVPTNGTFTLALGAEVTAPINYNATALDVQNALNALPSLSTTTVLGDFLIGFEVTFSGNDGGKDQPLLEVVTNTLRLNFEPLEIVVSLINQGGVTYSSAQTAIVHYKNFPSATKNSFAIGVANQPVDDTLARVLSLNLDARTDTYVSAETNDIFTKALLLEEGDYNFRFRVVYSTTQGLKTRLVGNPFTFKTRQDLSTVQSGDQLVVGSTKYKLESTSRLVSNEYVLEFFEQFPSDPTDILLWSIERDGSTIISSNQKIHVVNPLRASVASDAEGAVANITLNKTETIKFEYISATAVDVFVAGTFNDFNPIQDKMTEEFDPRPIANIFDRSLTTEYQNNHINYHKVHVEPIVPTVVDRVRFYTGVPELEAQRVRLQLDDRPISKAEYLARKSDGSIADYILEGYGGSAEVVETFAPILGGVPDIIVTDEVLTPAPAITYATDIHTSILDGYIEWKYVQVGTNRNKTLRTSIDLLSRFDSYSGESREHIEFEIYSLPSIPQPVADFVAPVGSVSVQRLNKSGFAAPSNNVTVTYARRQALSQVPVALTALEDNGIVNNFYHANIESPGPTTKHAYIDIPHVFKVGEAIVVHNANTNAFVRTKIASIATDDTGLIECEDIIPQEGVIVKDYIIEEDENTFKATLEVPAFRLVFAATIFDYVVNLDDTTEIVFENPLGVDAASLLGGQLTYPILQGVAKIIDARNESIIGGPLDPINTNYQLKHLIVVTIDRPIPLAHPSLGCLVEVFNTTKRVTDYEISKSDGTVVFHNQSQLGSGSAQLHYTYDPVPYQVPEQMWCFEVLNPTDVVQITVEPQQYQISLREIDRFTVDFFDGLDGRAPSYVEFVVNNTYTGTVTYANSTIADGYGGDFDPSRPDTGNIREFSIAAGDMIPLDGYGDGYGQELLTSLSIRFAGQAHYCIGELESIVTTELLNSQCRVVLNGIELFKSPVPVGPFGRYKVQVEEGLVLVYFNGALIVRRPLVLQNPTVEFGATGKVYDDLVKADFKNIIIDRFYTESPAKIAKIGRYIEIEGTVIS